MRCFFYGTLMDPELLALVVGREVPGRDTEPAVLPGFRRVRVRGATFPALIAAPEAHVEGLAVSGLTERDIDRARFYEGDEFTLESVMITLREWNRTVGAAAFFRTTAVEVVDAAWSLSAWRAAPAWQRDLRLTRQWMELYGRYAADDPALNEIWQSMLSVEDGDAGNAPGR